MRGVLAKYIATARTTNHKSQAAGESSRNMDITGLASLSPMPIATKQIAGRQVSGTNSIRNLKPGIRRK
jgi:hypothetical protein